MKVLISAPSLDTKDNVSGISSVVNNILCSSSMKYVHFLVGKKDQQKRDIFWIFNQLSLPIKLVFTLFKNKIDIFHLNAPLDKLAVIRDFVLLLTAKLFRIKIVMHLHGGEYLKNVPKNKLFFKYLNFYFNRADHIIVLSSPEKEWLLENYDVDIKRVTSLENCVLLPENVEIEKKDKVRIIFIGRIVERKGVLNIVEALLKLDENRSDFEFYLYGTGPEEEKMISQLSMMSNNSFEFKGIVFDDSKIEAYSEADIFLLPSLFGEGLPMGLLEAMSYGNISIVTNDGSMATVIENEKNGYLVEKNNSEMLASVINALLDRFDNKEVLTIRNNAINTIKSKYDCRFYAKRLEHVYRNL